MKGLWWWLRQSSLQKDIWKLLPEDCSTYVSVADLCLSLFKTRHKKISERRMLWCLKKMKSSNKFPTKFLFENEQLWRRSKKSILKIRRR